MIHNPKALLFGLCCLIVLQASGQGIGNVRFGASFEDAVTHIKEKFGDPVKATGDEVVYANTLFEGFLWNHVMFRFQEGRLCEARFYRNHKNKIQAKAELESIAKSLGKKHELSQDYEEDGSRFYAGGQSPLGIGRLFTVFVAPHNGQWADQLRFGPFKFKNSEL